MWVKEFPFTGKIVGTERLKGKYGIDVRLHLQSPNSLTVCSFDAWGENKNFLVNTVSANTGDWIGKTVKIVKDGTFRRIVEAV